MKREDLAIYRINAQSTDEYLHKSEADEVMDAMEQRIKELEKENESLSYCYSHVRELNRCMRRDLPDDYIPMTDAERKESKILEEIYHYGCEQIDDVNKAYIDFVEHFAGLILNSSGSISLAFLEWRDWFNDKAKAKGITLEPMADVAKRFMETKKPIKDNLITEKEEK